MKIRASRAHSPKRPPRALTPHSRSTVNSLPWAHAWRAKDLALILARRPSHSQGYIADATYRELDFSPLVSFGFAFALALLREGFEALFLLAGTRCAILLVILSTTAW